MPQSRRQRALDLYARMVQKPTLAVAPVPLARLGFALNASLVWRDPRGLRLADASRPGLRPLTACTIRGAPEQNGTLLYLHGGGFTIGTLRGYRHLVARLGAAAGMRGLFLAYRLAPEHPFPAASDDALAAFRALAAEGPVALAGDSAGGNLALSVMHRTAGEGLPMPSACALFSPVADLRLVNPSLAANRRSDLLISERGGRRCIAAYLGTADPADPRASPVLGSFPGAPPTYIQVDRTEMLRDDAHAAARVLRRDGAEVTLDETAGLPHVNQLNAGLSPEADAAVARAGAFLRAAAARSGSRGSAGQAGGT